MVKQSRTWRLRVFAARMRDSLWRYGNWLVLRWWQILAIMKPLQHVLARQPTQLHQPHLTHRLPPADILHVIWRNYCGPAWPPPGLAATPQYIRTVWQKTLTGINIPRSCPSFPRGELAKHWQGLRVKTTQQSLSWITECFVRSWRISGQKLARKEDSLSHNMSR